MLWLVGAGVLVAVSIVVWVLVKRNNPEKAALAEAVIVKAADKVEAKVETEVKKIQ